jgi:hypothetical protein
LTVPAGYPLQIGAIVGSSAIAVRGAGAVPLGGVDEAVGLLTGDAGKVLLVPGEK